MRLHLIKYFHYFQIYAYSNLLLKSQTNRKFASWRRLKLSSEMAEFEGKSGLTPNILLEQSMGLIKQETMNGNHWQWAQASQPVSPLWRHTPHTPQRAKLHSILYLGKHKNATNDVSQEVHNNHVFVNVEEQVGVDLFLNDLLHSLVFVGIGAEQAEVFLQVWSVAVLQRLFQVLKTLSKTKSCWNMTAFHGKQIVVLWECRVWSRSCASLIPRAHRTTQNVLMQQQLLEWVRHADLYNVLISLLSQQRILFVLGKRVRLGFGIRIRLVNYKQKAIST